EGFIDLFRMNGRQRLHVKLELGILAYNLLTEEYPLAERDLHEAGKDKWLLDTEVADYAGVGRFVVGLLDDIRIIDTPDLQQYLKNYIQKYQQF
ncbi:MAG: transcriptional regulator, partial [Alistipes sp.]